MSLWKESHSGRSARSHERGYGAGGSCRGNTALKEGWNVTLPQGLLNLPRVTEKFLA
jgi:hypothetical protein